MNELQQKLARRRTLNGEGDPVTSSAATNPAPAPGPAPAASPAQSHVNSNPWKSKSVTTSTAAEPSVKPRPVWAKAGSGVRSSETQPPAPIPSPEPYNNADNGEHEKLPGVTVDADPIANVATLNNFKDADSNSSAPNHAAAVPHTEEPQIHALSTPTVQPTNMIAVCAPVVAAAAVMVAVTPVPVTSPDAVSAPVAPTAPVAAPTADYSSDPAALAVREDRSLSNPAPVTAPVTALVPVTAAAIPDSGETTKPVSTFASKRATEKLNRILETQTSSTEDDLLRSQTSLSASDLDFFKDISTKSSVSPQLSSKLHAESALTPTKSPLSKTDATEKNNDGTSEYNVDEFDDSYELIIDNKRTSKSGASLFDDLISGDASATSISRSSVSSVRNTGSKLNNIPKDSSASTGTDSGNGGDDEFEMLKKLIQDDDDDGISSLSRKGSGGVRFKKSSSPRGDLDDKAEPEAGTFQMSIEDAVKAQGPVTPAPPGKKRASFSSQKTNIKSWMNTLHLDPNIAVGNLFEVDEDMGGVAKDENNGNRPRRPSVAERELMKSLFADNSGGGDFLNAFNPSGVNDADAMDQLFSGTSGRDNSLGMDKMQGRNNLVFSSFVARENDAGEDAAAVGNKHLMNRLETHGLFSDAGDTSAGSGSTDGGSPAPALFKDNATVTAKKEKQPIQELAYEDFMRRLTTPQCNDLKQVVRSETIVVVLDYLHHSVCVLAVQAFCLLYIRAYRRRQDASE
jgi:hypothetical protein